MSSERYLPEEPGPDWAHDAVLHTRNKTILAEFAAPTWWERAIRRLWMGSAALRTSALSRGRVQVVISEQLIENALLLREADSSVRRALDFGGFESTMPLALASVGIDVTVVDQRRYPFRHPRLHVLQHDILNPMDTLANDFDLVYSISTLEHVGIGAYGDAYGEGADAVAVGHLWAKVRPGGRLLFTVPAGRATVARGYRIYSPEAVVALLPRPGTVRYFSKAGRLGTWEESSADAIAEHRYEDQDAELPVECIAVALVQKPIA